MTWKKTRCPFCSRRFMRIPSLVDHMVLKHTTRMDLIERYLKLRKETLEIHSTKRKIIEEFLKKSRMA